MKRLFYYFLFPSIALSIGMLLVTSKSELAATISFALTIVLLGSALLVALSGQSVCRHLLCLPVVATVYLLVVFSQDRLAPYGTVDPIKATINQLHRLTIDRPLVIPEIRPLIPKNSKETSPLKLVASLVEDFFEPMNREYQLPNNSLIIRFGGEDTTRVDFFVKCQYVFSLLLGWFSFVVSRSLQVVLRSPSIIDREFERP